MNFYTMYLKANNNSFDDLKFEKRIKEQKIPNFY